MDVATHALTGWTLARCGLDRLTPRAAWIAILAATAPDADLALRAIWPSDYLLWHRGPSHSWFLLPLIAAICVALVALVFRTRLPWVKAWLVAVAAGAGHLLIDAINPAGAQWFWPFNEEWVHIDLTRRGDPWIAAILCAFAAAPALSQLVSSEIGARSTKGRGAAIFALVLVCLYAGVRYQFHLRALAMLDSRLYDRVAPKRAAVVPEPLHPFRWDGLVDTGGFVRELPVDTLGQFNPDAGMTYYPPENQAAVEAVAAGSLYQRMRPRMSWTVAEAIPEDETIQVTIRELRLGWIYQAVVDKAGRLQSEKFMLDRSK